MFVVGVVVFVGSRRDRRRLNRNRELCVFGDKYELSHKRYVLRRVRAVTTTHLVPWIKQLASLRLVHLAALCIGAVDPWNSNGFIVSHIRNNTHMCQWSTKGVSSCNLENIDRRETLVFASRREVKLFAVTILNRTNQFLFGFFVSVLF